MEMNLVLASLPLPIRLKPEAPMSDDDLMRFSLANRMLRMEREANGEILVMIPTGTKTGKINLRVGRLLDEWAEVDGRGVAFDSSTGFRLANGSIRSPDASWIAIDRWEALTDDQQEGFGLCPDFVIELVSPSDRAAQVKKKILEEWMANGVKLAWVIDTKKRTVTMYRTGEKPEVLVEPSSVQGEGPVRGFELVMGRVWG